ncbi:hypothetical protein JMG10_28235 [Nostoc ellipsosporum NOK]|nr:hypothetical protein [Nostoc ellipsosporum NOK]
MHRFETYHIYLIPMLLAAVLSLRVFIEKWPKPYRIFSALLFATLIIEFGAIFWMWDWHYIFGWNYTDTNTWIYNAGLLVRLALIAGFYYMIVESAKVRRLILWTGSLALLLLALNYIKYPHTTFIGYFLVFDPVMMLLAALYFRQFLLSDDTIPLEKDPAIWISMGVVMSGMPNIPVFAYIDEQIKTNMLAALNSLYYNDAINILTYTLFLIAFLCKPQPKQQPLSSSLPHW